MIQILKYKNKDFYAFTDIEAQKIKEQYGKPEAVLFEPESADRAIIKENTETKEEKKYTEKEWHFDNNIIDITADKDKLIEKLLSDRFPNLNYELSPANITISKLAKAKIMRLIKEYPNFEWLGIMTGRKSLNSFIVEDIEICEQENTGSFTELTNKGNKELSETKNVIGWIHSHNTMSVFHSGTDVHTAGNFDLSITINNELETDIKVKHTFNGITIFKKGILTEEQDNILNESWMIGIKSKIKVKTYEWSTRNEWTDQEELDDICVLCGKDLPKNIKKRGECRFCHTTSYHKRCLKEVADNTANEGMCLECINENEDDGYYGYPKDTGYYSAW
jgi:hypothetical protein